MKIKNQNSKVKKSDEEERAQKLEDQLMRLAADYQNREKRISEEKLSWIKNANKDLILKLLPILDHLETVLKTAKDKGQGSSWLDGIEMVVREFREILSNEGLEPVQTDHFDPQVHEVVEVREGPEGQILDVLNMGYKLNDKLIKPAKVVVGKESIDKKTEDVVKQEEQRGDYM